MMKFEMKNLFVACFLTAGSLSFLLAYAGQDSPVKCKIFPFRVVCSVVSDNVRLDDIVYNRGNCNAPEAAKDEDFKSLKEFATVISELKIDTSKLFTPDGLPNELSKSLSASSDIKNALIGRGINELDATRYGEVYSRIGKDPRGRHYRFGDEFTLPVLRCNLIEFDITLNDQVWTFK